MTTTVPEATWRATRPAPGSQIFLVGAWLHRKSAGAERVYRLENLRGTVILPIILSIRLDLFILHSDT